MHRTGLPLTLSLRARNTLYNAGYWTVAQVASASDRDLLFKRNLGAALLREIRTVIPYRAPVCPYCQGTGVMPADPPPILW
jgi:hypothetical protein